MRTNSLHRERDRRGRDQDRLAEPVARVQRRDHHAADQHAPAARDRRRDHEGERKAGDRIADAERDRRRDAADRPVGAEHRDLAEREIDPPDQAVDQRIGGREQRVDRRERERIDQLLQRIGGGRRELRQPPGAALRPRARLSREIALEKEEPRLPERPLVGLDRHEIEPVALERRPAEATGSEVRLARRTRLARRVIDAQPRAAARAGPTRISRISVPSACSTGRTRRQSRSCSESVTRPQPARTSGSRTAKRTRRMARRYANRPVPRRAVYPLRSTFCRRISCAA